ncbi:1731_t:CDS:2, partial [Funneliformis geosporum]
GYNEELGLAFKYNANINDEVRIRNILDQSNVLDNSAICATIRAIRNANARAITEAVASFPNVLLGLAGADIISVREHDEDWTIAKG